MYSTSVYHYIPRQIVVLATGNSTRRYQQVYSKNLTLHKGVDNKLQFQFLNQEQKPVNITDRVITLRLLSFDGKTTLLTKSLSGVLPLTGIAELRVAPAEIEHIEVQRCYYTMEIPDGGFDLPIFVDHSSGARGTIDIVNSIRPSFTKAKEITIPTHTAMIPGGITYFSDILSTDDNPILTIQTLTNDYTGTIQVQGSTTGTTEWYNIDDPYVYDHSTETNGYTFQGYHPYIRLMFVSSNGTVDKILAR